MAKCKICGSRLAVGVTNCPACGAVVGEEPNAQNINVANSSIEKSVCPSCGKQVLGEHRFCPYCGENLKEPENHTVQNKIATQPVAEQIQSEQESETQNTNPPPFQQQNVENNLTGQTFKVVLNHSHTGSLTFYPDSMIFTPNKFLENFMAIASFDIFGYGRQKELEIPYSLITSVEIQTSSYSFCKTIYVWFQEGAFSYSNSLFHDNHLEIYAGFNKKTERDKILKYLLLKINQNNNL